MRRLTVPEPEAVAARAAALGCLRVTHRDAPDMVLTTAMYAERSEENLTTASRLFLALMKQDGGARSLLLALPEVFPWVRHLDDEEAREFTVELPDALSDAAELGAREAVHRAIVSWRATARSSADPDQLREALRPPGDVDLARSRCTGEPEERRPGKCAPAEWPERHPRDDEAATGWEQLCRVALPNAHRCLEALRTDPLSRANWHRRHQIRGRHSTREWKGSALEQWEYEITSGGRVRYLISPETSTVILVHASTRHPKDTE